MWFLLGSIKDYEDKCHKIPYEDLRTTDKIVLHQMAIFYEKVQNKYELYDFEGATFLIQDFMRDKLNTDYMGINSFM